MHVGMADCHLPILSEREGAREGAKVRKGADGMELWMERARCILLCEGPSDAGLA